MAGSVSALQGERAAHSERPLRIWMTAVGVFYVLLGLRLLPWINGPMVAAFGDTATPGVQLEAGTPEFLLLIDWMATFGLDLLVLGVGLVVAARNAISHRALAWVVIGQEAVRGIVADLWFVARPFNAAAFYLGFILVHVIVIATGVWALRRAAPAALAAR